MAFFTSLVTLPVRSSRNDSQQQSTLNLSPVMVTTGCPPCIGHVSSSILFLMSVRVVFGKMLIRIYFNILTTKIKTIMRARRKTIKISRERAVEIAANHNVVSREIAERYTVTELKEVLRCLRLTPNF
jgi:hypothetical protein